MSENNRDYIVAFRYTEKTGGFAGIITWTVFANKADADQHLKDLGGRLEVVEEDITEKRAVELVRTTPVQAYLCAAVEKATINGKLNLPILEVEVANAMGTIRYQHDIR